MERERVVEERCIATSCEQAEVGWILRQGSHSYNVFICTKQKSSFREIIGGATILVCAQQDGSADRL